MNGNNLFKCCDKHGARRVLVNEDRYEPSAAAAQEGMLQVWGSQRASRARAWSQGRLYLTIVLLTFPSLGVERVFVLLLYVFAALHCFPKYKKC